MIQRALAFSVLCMVMATGSAWAAGSRGSFSIGANIGISNASQDDMNTLIDRANIRAGGISTSDLGNAWDGNAFISYRLDGSYVALQLRPGFFLQSEDGRGGGASFDYSVTGFTVFPMVRFYMLEDDTMAFFSQVGIGVGMISGEIKEGANSVEFSGSNMGYQAGLGAEFCLFGGIHCIQVEANWRILNVQRVIADDVNGDFTSGSPNPPSLSQAVRNQEVEIDGRDLSVSLSGIVGTIGYAYYF